MIHLLLLFGADGIAGLQSKSKTSPIWYPTTTCPHLLLPSSPSDLVVHVLGCAVVRCAVLCCAVLCCAV